MLSPDRIVFGVDAYILQYVFRAVGSLLRVAEYPTVRDESYKGLLSAPGGGVANDCSRNRTVRVTEGTRYKVLYRPTTGLGRSHTQGRIELHEEERTLHTRCTLYLVPCTLYLVPCEGGT